MAKLKTLMFAMGIRVMGSLAYIALILLANWQGRVDDAAVFVYVIAVAYVASAFGRIGTDQLLSASAPAFRRSYRTKAASITYSHLVSGAVLVPLAAMIIHLVISLLGKGAVGGIGVPMIALVALLFSLCQTVGTVNQASGHPTLSVFFFPLGPYILLLMANAAGFNLTPHMIVLAFGALAVAGLFWLTRRLPFDRRRLSTRWISKSFNYYVMGINFYLTAWIPFTYLHLFLDASQLVMLNLAMRLAAIQSMPLNTITGYLMPAFAVNFRKGDIRATETTMRHVIVLTMAFQIVYLAALGILYQIAPTWVGFDMRAILLLLIILSVGQFVNGLTGPVGPALLMAGEQKQMAVISTVLNLIFLPAGVLGAWFWGSLGFAGATSLAIVVQNVFYTWLLNKHSGLFALHGLMSAVLRRVLGQSSRP